MFNCKATPPALLLLFGILGACSSSSEHKASSQAVHVSSQEAGVELIAPDARTQNPRQRRIYQQSGAQKLLARVESDFNGDGRVDFIQSYDPSGAWVNLEKSDLDGDGRFDVSYLFAWDSSRKRSLLTEQHFDTNYDGDPDLWKNFDTRGRLTVRKLDRNFDGNADYWEFYDNGQVVRIEQDSNYDGTVDLIPAPRTTRR